MYCTWQHETLIKFPDAKKNIGSSEALGTPHFANADTHAHNMESSDIMTYTSGVTDN